MSSDRIWPAVHYNISNIYIRYFPEAKGLLGLNHILQILEGHLGKLLTLADC